MHAHAITASIVDVDIRSVNEDIVCIVDGISSVCGHHGCMAILTSRHRGITGELGHCKNVDGDVEGVSVHTETVRDHALPLE